MTTRESGWGLLTEFIEGKPSETRTCRDNQRAQSPRYVTSEREASGGCIGILITHP